MCKILDSHVYSLLVLNWHLTPLQRHVILTHYTVMKAKSSANRKFPGSEELPTLPGREHQLWVSLTTGEGFCLLAAGIQRSRDTVQCLLLSLQRPALLSVIPALAVNGQIAFYTVDNDSDTSEVKNKSCHWNFSEIWWKSRNRRFSYQRGIWLKLQAQFSFKKLSQECFTYS